MARTREVDITRVGIASLLCLVASAALDADTYPRQPDVDAIHDVFTLELTDAGPEITGWAAVELRIVKAGVTTFGLDLASPADGKDMTVTGVAATGTAATYTHQAHRLRIVMATPAAVDEPARSSSPTTAHARGASGSSRMGTANGARSART